MKPTVHYSVLFSSRISEPFWYILRTIKITLSVICVIPIMWATHADTCINALKNIRVLPLRNMSEINMGGTQVTYLLDSRSYGRA